MNKTEQKKILVIEDDSILSKNIKEILEENNFIVKTEPDGASGTKSVIQWMPDLIICDIALPVKNGYEVLEEVSKMNHVQQIPFIFLTAKVEREDIRKGMHLGADDYIFKPFDIDDLLNSIKLRLEKYKQKEKTEAEEKEDEHKIYEMSDKIIVKNGNKVNLLTIKDLKYLKAKNPYILLKFSNGKNSLQRQTLEEWESRLPSKFFLRIHRSTIVNMEFIIKIEKLGKTSYILRLREEEEPFIISKRYISRIKNRLS